MTPKWHQKWCQKKSLFDAGFRLKNSSDTVLGVEKFSSILKHGYIKLYSLQGGKVKTTFDEKFFAKVLKSGAKEHVID